MTKVTGAGRASRHVDYDRIAPAYDQRFKANRLDGVCAALQALAQDLQAEQILEVGCGTGRWLADLALERRRLYGLDLSAGMLDEAARRGESFWLAQGRGGRLPFHSETMDLVFCVNAIHHFDDPEAFIHEAQDVLRPGGAVAVVGSDPHGRRDDWYVYDMFEGTYETDLKRFPTWGAILDWMTASGVQRTTWQVVEHIVDHKVGREVLEDPFLRKNACSQLALLSDEGYAAGLRRIEATLARAEVAGETLVFPVNIVLAMMVGLRENP